MEVFAAVMGAIFSLFQHPFTVYGFAFSFWEVLLFGVAVSFICIIVRGFF